MYFEVKLETYEYSDPYFEESDGWQRADTYQELNSVSVVGTKVKPEGWRARDTELDVEYGDEVFVVIANYSTGDTFGRDDGRLDVFDVFKTKEEAGLFVEWLRSVEPTYSSVAPDVAKLDSRYKAKSYYIPWFGYFESLNSIDIHSARVSP